MDITSLLIRLISGAVLLAIVGAIKGAMGKKG
jgi:hypothetical protein